MSEGIVAIQMRMAEIRSRFATPPPPMAPPVAAPGPSTAAPSFQDFFSQATAAAAAPTANVDLSKFPNGRIPENFLKSIGGGDKLAPKAAEAFLQMRADAERAGIKFGVNDSYRSYDEQVDTAKRLGLYSQGGLAAKPGTSDHGRGLSVDLELGGSALSWMRNNAGKYGFKNDVPGESWHWTYKR